MKNSERQKFQEYLGKWRQGAGPSDEAEIGEYVTSLYADLDLERPEIIMCRGPIQQAIFPTLVFLMLKLGQEQTNCSEFKKLSSFGASDETHNVWSDLWREAYDCLEWKHPDCRDSATGRLLNSRLFSHIDKSLKNHAIAQIDQEIGFERHQKWESAFKNSMQGFHHNLRNALLNQYINSDGVWRSFVGRLPSNFIAELQPPRRQYARDSLSRTKRPDLRDWVGCWDWITLATCDFAREYLQCKFDEQADKRLNMLINIAFGASAYQFYEHCCFVYLRPERLFLDENVRPHSSEGAAIEFSDGTEIFVWHGWEVPEKVIKDPGGIRVVEIDRERNLEVRRIMIERYGLEKFLRDSAARTIHKDKYGRLYRKELPGDEPIVVVKVENSTAEPDGSNRYYFLRVPPDITTARAAVAWTFGMTETQYAPKKET
jgi:hypothetical protein